MNKKQLLEKYLREADNLNHNIKFEIDKNKNIAWNGETNYKLVDYMQGQLSIMREVVHFLKGEYDHLFDGSFPIDYILGYPIN